MSKRFNNIVAALAFLLSFVVLGSIGLSRVDAADQGTPKPQINKVYHAIYSCQSTPIPENQIFIASCYQEYWRVLAVGKDGWLRVMTTDENGSLMGEYWVNVNRLQAIREMVRKDATPPPAHVDPATTEARR